MSYQTSQTSKAALTGLDRAEFLAMSTRTQRPSVSAELTQVYSRIPSGGEGEDATMPDWDLVQEANAGLVEESARQVRQADQGLRLNRVRNRQLRRRRKSVVGRLRQRHRDYRKSFEGTHGEEALPLVGLDAPPARSYLAVREQSLETLERMRDPELPSRLPEPRSGQSPLDLTQLADDMEADILELDRLMEEIRQMRKVLDESLIAKRKALREHRRVLANVARIQEGYYRLAKLDDLADRIRTSRPQRRSAAEPTETAETPETSSSSSQEEAP